MPEDHIRYDILAQDALRGVIRKVLAEVARTGLPGEHHFYITFGTRLPGVRLSSRLASHYPEDMTIVLQHQFWDLTVSEHAFEVGLSFGNVPERLLVPFTAVKSFVDPSVQFALQFEPQANTVGEAAEAGMAEEDGAEIAMADFLREEAAPASASETGAGAPAPAPAKEEAARVVSLEAFRKKS